QANGETVVDYRHHPTVVATHSSARETLFTAVRCGNVLGSRGSVVPTFERQIERGGPVTVTHPDMTRYFMSIPEAVSLIIQAATLTDGNDIFMLDMGQQIRIDELARRLIRLRGLRPDIDISIVYTGIRPGEKMEERLMADGEERSRTSHSHIFRLRATNGQSRSVTRSQVDQLIALANAQRNDELVALLHELAGS
ncbi:MAG: polysaccharide biosynthesis protein, partial [Dehalococcoidia bacterium]|nr:polysaccharide biosynthesis protein [Dehalococcoidia bacterium]